MDRGWRRKARPDQLPPEGEWEQLFYRGGRGSGKTWAASHSFAELIDADPLREAEGPRQWAIVAPTFADVRDTCVESESGLLAALGTTTTEVAAGRSRTVELWNRSIGELRLRDGSRVFCDGADDGALRIQGRNLRGVWGDEIGLWKRWETAWDESLAYALRKGDARLIATGTPKADQPARVLVRRLLEDPAVVVRRLRTFHNLLLDAFLVRTLLVPALLALVGERSGWPGRRLRAKMPPPNDDVAPRGLERSPEPARGAPRDGDAPPERADRSAGRSPPRPDPRRP